MAKQRTTGGPRVRRASEADLQRRREYRSRAERERMWQRRIIAVVAILIGLSILVLGYGVVNDELIAPRQAITTVNGEEITTARYQDRVRLIRWQTADELIALYNLTGGNIDSLGEQGAQYFSQQMSNLQRPLLIGSQVLDEMEEELLLKQAASEWGITVDESAVEERVDQFMAGRQGIALPPLHTATPTTEPTVTPTPLVSPTPTRTPEPTPTATPAADESEATPVPAEVEEGEEPAPEPTVEPEATFTPTATLERAEILATVTVEAGQWFDEALDATGVERAAARELFYYEALRLAIYEHLSTDVPAEELQVNARHMLFSFNPANPSGATPPTDEQRTDAEARAEAAQAALQAGEPFADLAEAVSNDTGSAARGGELGWASPNNYVEPFRDTVLQAEPGEIVGPVETQFGFHIIQVHGREVRPLTSTELANRRNTAFQDWLNQRKAEADISRRDDWLDRVPEDPSYNRLLSDILRPS